MNAHEQFADDLAIYAVGALEGDERAALEHHLQDCAACRRELDALRGDLASLALSASQAAPPARARQRLLSAIAAEPRRQPAPSRNLWWALVPSLAAACLALIALVLWSDQSRMRGELADLQRNNAKQEQQLRQANEVVATLTDPAAVRFTLSAAKTPPQPQGKTIYARDRGTLIFVASNMPALPAQKTYELWLIASSGAAIPAGLFQPDAHGNATLINPPLPAGVDAKTFAITVEPASGSPAPTSQPIMVGVGG